MNQSVFGFSLDNSESAVTGKNREVAATQRSGLILSQTQRRKLYIQKQKKGRSAQLDSYRSLGYANAPDQEDITDENASYDSMVGIGSGSLETNDSDVTPSTESMHVEGEIEAAVSHNKSNKGKSSGSKLIPFAACIPEYMLEIPQLVHGESQMQSSSSSSIADDIEDEPESWMFRVRPQGTSCLVSTLNSNATTGTAHCFSTANTILCSFRSLLPKNCVLECVLDEENMLLFAIDVLVWKGQELVDTTCEFRLFWLSNKLSECHRKLFTHNEANDYAIVDIPFFNCDITSLFSAYSNETGLIKYSFDGFLFFHKFGYYQQGLTPLVLQWKDKHCVSYGIAENDEIGDQLGLSTPIKLIAQAMSSSASAQSSQLQLCTLEELSLYRVPNRIIIQGVPKELRHGDLVTCRCGTIGYRSLASELDTAIAVDQDMKESQLPYIDHIVIEKITPKSRVNKVADSWSKIVVNNAARLNHQLISFEDIANAVNS